MATNRTFTMIKPDAVQDNHIGGILSMIEAGGFRIVELQKVTLTPERAGEFYAVHKERPFYNDLVKYMSSGPIVAAVLEKDNAVADFRTLIGATNPANAEDGTIRKKYAKSIEANAVHGSDSDENAQIEATFSSANEVVVGGLRRSTHKKPALQYAERAFSLYQKQTVFVLILYC